MAESATAEPSSAQIICLRRAIHVLFRIQQTNRILAALRSQRLVWETVPGRNITPPEDAKQFAQEGCDDLSSCWYMPHG